jgi:hypothetical protein
MLEQSEGPAVARQNKGAKTTEKGGRIHFK